MFFFWGGGLCGGYRLPCKLLLRVCSIKTISTKLKKKRIVWSSSNANSITQHKNTSYNGCYGNLLHQFQTSKDIKANLTTSNDKVCDYKHSKTQWLATNLYKLSMLFPNNFCTDQIFLISLFGNAIKVCELHFFDNFKI